MMRRAVIGCIAAVLSSGLVQGQQRRGVQSEAVDFAAMTEDIEIMQQIIGKTLRQHFAGDGEQAALLNAVALPMAKSKYKEGEKLTALTHYMAAQEYQLAFSFGQFNVEGFYVPGTGVVFTLDLPVAAKVVELKEEEDEPDLWEEIEGKVRGKRTEALLFTSGSFFTTGKQPKTRTTIDQEALDESTDLLVKTVGEYGSRIEQLSAGESIILAAETSARGSWHTPQRLLEATYTSVYVNTQGVKPHRIIIKVPVQAIRDFENEELDFDMLKDSSEITQYRKHGAVVPSSSE